MSVPDSEMVYSFVKELSNDILWVASEVVGCMNNYGCLLLDSNA